MRRAWLGLLLVPIACAEIAGLGDYKDAVDGGLKCVPPLPAGWQWLAYNPNFRPICPSGYSTPLDVEEGITAAAATCGCTCTTTQPTCGTITITAGSAGTNGCENNTKQVADSDGGCDTSSQFMTGGGDNISVTDVPANGGCNPDASVTASPVTYGSRGRTCLLATPSSGSCGAGAVSVSDPLPFTMCVVQSGDIACPAGYATKHLVGSAVTDGRGCSPCKCGFDAGTCSGNVTFYKDKCSGGSTSVNVNGGCQAASGGMWGVFTYTPTQIPATCAPSPVTATGGAAFGDLETVCCAN